jgi:pimeloyl-ACP methyl ester carboxylesterase
MIPREVIIFKIIKIEEKIILMLAALEGSSPTIFGENNKKYYVWIAYMQTKQGEKIYVPGPATISTVGSPINIRKMADSTVQFIKGFESTVFLIGWSRGAAACIQVALDLKRSGSEKKIEAMFLFDPVDQDGSTGDFLNTIPNNVANCYRAKATKKEGVWGKVFPTCGNFAENGVNYVSRDFNTSHGGIAGTEGGTKGDDGAGNWMWTNMSIHGVV